MKYSKRVEPYTNIVGSYYNMVGRYYYPVECSGKTDGSAA